MIKRTLYKSHKLLFTQSLVYTELSLIILSVENLRFELVVNHSPRTGQCPQTADYCYLTILHCPFSNTLNFLCSMLCSQHLFFLTSQFSVNYLSFSVHHPISLFIYYFSFFHNPVACILCIPSSVHHCQTSLLCPKSSVSVHYLLFNIRCPVSLVHYPLISILCPLSTTHCKLSYVNYLLTR